MGTPQASPAATRLAHRGGNNGVRPAVLRIGQHTVDAPARRCAREPHAWAHVKPPLLYRGGGATVVHEEPRAAAEGKGQGVTVQDLWGRVQHCAP